MQTFDSEEEVYNSLTPSSYAVAKLRRVPHYYIQCRVIKKLRESSKVTITGIGISVSRIVSNLYDDRKKLKEYKESLTKLAKIRVLKQLYHQADKLVDSQLSRAYKSSLYGEICEVRGSMEK